MKRVMSLLALVMLVTVVVSPVSAADVKEWTWMVFLNADNNLDQFGVKDQEEMSQVGSNDWLNIVSLIDREKGPATLNYIEKGAVKPVKEMGELDMGDYKQLVSFVKDTVAAYPAKKYALIIWNHGSGWKNATNNITKGISYDDSTGNHITTEQLGLAMNEIKGILGNKNLDILSMDACLMQMIEVSYAVRNSVDYVVASEETEPGDGYPYGDILKTLEKSSTPADLAKKIVAAYAASYNNGSAGNSASTQSAVDCKKIDALKDAIDGFAKVAIAGKYGQQFKDALVKVQKFYYRTNIDLAHLVECINITDEAYKTAAKKLTEACAAATLANGNTGATMKNAKGIAIYFPATSYSFAADYNKLAFAQESMWDEMVQDFYKKTTAPSIIADLENGDISSLQEYVKSANENNREVSADLISKLNFRAFAEGDLSAATNETLKSLVSELKAK